MIIIHRVNGYPRLAMRRSAGGLLLAPFARNTGGNSAGNTGNLLALTDVGRYDLGGIGGSIYTDRAAALALAGSLSIVRASLVIDSYGGNDRTFIINGISAESTAAVPEPGSMLLLGSGLIGLAAAAGRRRARR